MFSYSLKQRENEEKTKENNEETKRKRGENEGKTRGWGAFFAFEFWTLNAADWNILLKHWQHKVGSVGSAGFFLSPDGSVFDWKVDRVLMVVGLSSLESTVQKSSFVNEW